MKVAVIGGGVAGAELIRAAIPAPPGVHPDRAKVPDRAPGVISRISGGPGQAGGADCKSEALLRSRRGQSPEREGATN